MKILHDTLGSEVYVDILLTEADLEIIQAGGIINREEVMGGLSFDIGVRKPVKDERDDAVI